MIGTLNEQILRAESVFSNIEWSLWSNCLRDTSASLSFAEMKCKCLFVSLFCLFVYVDGKKKQPKVFYDFSMGN